MREWFGEHMLHTTLCIKRLCFAFDQMSSCFSAAGYGWSGSYGSWYGRRRGSWSGKSEVRFDVEWFCQMCSTGIGGVVRIADTVRVSRTTMRTRRRLRHRRKLLSWRRRQLVWVTTSLFWLAREFWRNNSKKSKRSSMPEENGKAHRGQIKLDQQRIQTLRVRECKIGGVAREPQSAKRNFESGLRGDQDSPGRPGERRRIDGQKQEPLHVSGEHRRNSNPPAKQELAFWRRSASKRLAGWTRDGSAEEIAGWMLEAQRLNREVEAKKRKLQEAIEQESGREARMSGWFSVVVRVQTRILQATSEWKRLSKWKNSGLSSAVTDPVSLKVLSWNVAGLSEDSRDTFLSQISMDRQSEMERTIEDCWVCGKMDCGRAGWSGDFHFSPFALYKGKNLGEFETVLMEIQEFVNGRPKQHVILGGDFNASLYSMTDFFHVGESIPRPRTLVDTNDSLRARALHTMVTELDLTVKNTWMDADTERELFTRSSWSNPEDSLTQMDFIMTSRKLQMKHVQVLDSDWFKTDHRSGSCCHFVETENEIHVEEWYELAWLQRR